MLGLIFLNQTVNSSKNDHKRPYFLIRYSLGITKIPVLKYSMRIVARKFDFSNLCTEKFPSFDLKRGTFIILVPRRSNQGSTVP